MHASHLHFNIIAQSHYRFTPNRRNTRTLCTFFSILYHFAKKCSVNCHHCHLSLLFFFAAEAITQNTNHPKQSITSLLQFKILHFIFKHATLLNLLTYSSWYGVSCFFTDLNSSFILFVLFSHQLTNNITPYSKI